MADGTYPCPGQDGRMCTWSMRATTRKRRGTEALQIPLQVGNLLSRWPAPQMLRGSSAILSSFILHLQLMQLQAFTSCRSSGADR